MRVLVLNHYSRNKGDQAILSFILRELRAFGVDEVAVSASEPQIWRDTPGTASAAVRVVPWGGGRPPTSPCLRRIDHHFRLWMLRCALFPLARLMVEGRLPCSWWRHIPSKELARAIAWADLVISTGGHHVTTWLAKDAVCWQTLDVGCSLLAGKQTVLWAQSFGPLAFADPRNERYIGGLLRRTWRVYARDEQSAHELVPFGLQSAQVHLTRDSVMGLCDAVASRPPNEREPLAGIAVYASRRRRAPEQAHYVRTMAALVDWLVARAYTPVFFPMEVAADVDTQGGDDRALIQEIIRHARSGTSCRVQQLDHGTLGHLEEVSKCRLFVGHKTHSVVFALITGTPVVAISYHSKTTEFMASCGLAEYVVDDRELSSGALLDRLSCLEANASDVHTRALAATRRMGQAVRSDFRQMLESAGETGQGTP